MLRMRQKDIKVLFVETQFYHLVSLFYLVHSYNTYQSNPIWGLMDEHRRSGGRGRCCLQLTQFTEDLWPLSFLISQDYFGRLSILLSYHLQEWLVAWGGTLQFKIAAIGQISAFLLLDGCSFICSIVYLHNIYTGSSSFTYKRISPLGHFRFSGPMKVNGGGGWMDDMMLNSICRSEKIHIAYRFFCGSVSVPNYRIPR